MAQPDIPALSNAYQGVADHYNVIAAQAAHLHNLPALNNQVILDLRDDINNLRTDLNTRVGGLEARVGGLDARVGDLQTTVANGFAELRNLMQTLFTSTPTRATNVFLQNTRLVDMQGNPLPVPFVTRDNLLVATNEQIEGLRAHLHLAAFPAGTALLEKKNIICDVIGIQAFRVHAVGGV
ncbi:hypothetical protein C8Q75DRAFT_812181 [Abortiporus biennis]|nr:hypothetical protein C8Q75DRAFT_812181 [Abortiporus biennis]